MPGEISRTDMSTNPPKTEECPTCKNKDVSQIGGCYISPFMAYHNYEFVAFSCFCCGAVWSYLTEKGRRQQREDWLSFRIPFV